MGAWWRFAQACVDEHIKARLKLVYDTEQAIPAQYEGQQPDVTTYRWDTNDYDFDCAGRMVAISQSVLHGAEDQVVGRLDIPARARTFRKVQPKSSAGKILETVCGWDVVEEKPVAPTQVTQAANPIDFYPPGSMRRQEQGAPVVHACVGPDGKLLRDPIVTDTSGFPDLDAAAIKVAKATRYAAGTDNGSPMPESCIKFRVKFVLNNQPSRIHDN
jgi:TonB family protein